jgi:DNA-directed RNA polymerase sigma subunit (sigma70/sigma32)
MRLIADQARTIRIPAYMIKKQTVSTVYRTNCCKK